MNFELLSVLPQLARSVVGLRRAATASESVWSTSGKTVTKRRESLKTDNVKLLVFLLEIL